MTRSDRIQTVDEVVSYLMLPEEVLAVLLPSARRLHAATIALGNSAHADMLRMDICHRLRLGQDMVFAAEGDPIKGYTALLDTAATCLETSARLPILQSQSGFRGASPEVLDGTAEHYNRLWGAFSPGHYFGEATQLLHTRMSRNEIDLAWFKGKRALDCGCGGGDTRWP